VSDEVGGDVEPTVPDPFIEEGNDIEGARENAQTPAGGTE
jgi:hypothetical protein